MSEPKTVPKFGSFRPKTAPQPPQVPEEDKRRRHSSRDRVEESGKEHRKHRHHHRRQSSRSREREKHVTGSQRPHHGLAPQENPPEVFFVDKKGDEKNLIYGSIHRYSVPTFYRIGAGGVLGAHSNLKIDRDHDDGKSIVLYDWRKSKTRTREKYVFSRVERERPRLLRIRSEALNKSSKDSSADFISLNLMRGKKRKRGIVDSESSGSENDDTHYRSIHGRSKPNTQPEDELLQYATDNETSGSEAGLKPESSMAERHQNVEFSRRVEQDPHDIEAWLALIQHQDVILRGQNDRRRATNAEIRSTADIKIHMYEKALEKAVSLKDREKLLLGLMAEGSKIWESKVQSDRWEKITQDNIDSLMLWKSYVGFKQTNFSSFRYDDTRDIFITRIKLLLDTAPATKNKELVLLYQQVIYVLLRLTTFMRESSYPELAIAIWQALLEFNLFRPEQVLSKADDVRLFNDFWESEVPRIGEDSARGWRDFVENAGDADENISQAQEDRRIEKSKLFESWAATERSRSKASMLPARTMDEATEDDPYRVILFADIEDFLIKLPIHFQALQKSLLNAFLRFCKLPQMFSANQESTHEIWDDSYIEDDLLECDPTWILNQYEPEGDQTNGNIDISEALKTPLSSFQNTPEAKFTSGTWFKSICAWTGRYNSDQGPVPYKWVRTTLKQLAQVHNQQDLAEYFLAFEWSNEPETIKKTSKMLLKAHPSSLKLYNAYAMIEWARGNQDVACGVFQPAIQMCKSMPEGSQRDSILLWRNWIWASLEAGSKRRAVQLLISIEPGTLVESDDDPSPTVTLMTKQYLSSSQDYLMSSGDHQHAVMYCECLALFEYLTSTSDHEPQSAKQGNITSALSIYTSLSQSFATRSLSTNVCHELLHQSAARLLYHHILTGPFRPSLLRSHLTRSITLFPHNSIFLSLYTWNESRLRIDNRVRALLLSTVLTPGNDSLPSRLFAISYELTHGTIHSVRAAFEHAVASPAAKAAAGLWRFYFLYCLETPEFRGYAKEVWYRALRACPWAKELYVLGFEKMGALGLVGREGLKSTWRIMEEKGLRVHVDLEDIFEELEEE